MRDPDLVQRAERAAGALERAWDRWRSMHGFGSEPLPPVSSYVGYSMEEPWGQPRVVFGVAADEAERLAALLDGHDCYGPVHAEVAGRPDWRRMPATDAGTAAWAADDYLSIPQQARPPAADMLPPGVPADGALELDRNVFGPSAADSAHWERAATVDPGSAVTGDVGPTGFDGEPEPGDQAEFAGADPIGTLPEMTPQELAPLPPLPDPSPAGPVGSASLAPARARKNTKASRGSAYRGLRYQGSAPRYKAAPGPAEESQADAEDATTGSAVPAARAAAADPPRAESAVAPPSVSAPPTVVEPESAGAPETALTPEIAVAAESAVAPPSVAAPPTVVEPESAGAPPTVAAPRTVAAQQSAVPPEATVYQDPVVDQDSAVDKDSAVDQDPAVDQDQDLAVDQSPADAKDTARAADASVAKPAAAGATKPARTRSRQASKANRARRQGPGAHEAWDSLAEESADSSM